MTQEQEQYYKNVSPVLMRVSGSLYVWVEAARVEGILKDPCNNDAGLGLDLPFESLKPKAEVVNLSWSQLGLDCTAKVVPVVVPVNSEVESVEISIKETARVTQVVDLKLDLSKKEV
jgi:hypothetical protein